MIRVQNPPTPQEFFAGKEIHYTFNFNDLRLKYKTWATTNTNGLYSVHVSSTSGESPLTAHMDIEDEATPAEAFELVPKFVSRVLPQLVLQEMKQQRELSN